MGFNPEHPTYNRDAKRWILARLLPLVEANYHLVELAPKGTGKSFIFENISNRVAVISGGKTTPAQLFINGKNKEVGLLGRHDVVVLDEVQSLTFDNPDEVIGPLKTYLANGRYNRAGFADISSDCSLVMLANIDLNTNLQPRSPTISLPTSPISSRKQLSLTGWLASFPAGNPQVSARDDCSSSRAKNGLLR